MQGYQCAVIFLPVVKSSSQLRVPLRWRGQATAAVVTESTKPQTEPAVRYVCSQLWLGVTRAPCPLPLSDTVCCFTCRAKLGNAAATGLDAISVCVCVCDCFYLAGCIHQAFCFHSSGGQGWLPCSPQDAAAHGTAGGSAETIEEQTVGHHYLRFCLLLPGFDSAASG